MKPHTYAVKLFHCKIKLFKNVINEWLIMKSRRKLRIIESKRLSDNQREELKMIQNKKSEIKLVLYSEQFKRDIDNYIITQVNFTGTPGDALKLCARDEERHAVLVVHEEKLVGFFILHEWSGAKKYTDNPHALLLRTFSIDSRYQCQGYGRQTVENLEYFIKRYFLDINEIVLGVNHNNVPAQHLYLHHGFVDTGRKVIGIHGEQWVLSKKIK